MSKNLTSEDIKVLDIIEREWEYSLESIPEIATFLGDHRYNDRLSDFSENAMLKREEHCEEVLKELKNINISDLSEENSLNYYLFLEKTENELKDFKFKSYYFMINQMEGIQANLPHMIMMMPDKTEKDFENYLSRLNKLPEHIDQTISILRKGLIEKYTVPYAAMANVPSQIMGQIPANFKDSPYYDLISGDKTNLSNELREKIETAIKEKVYSSFKKLNDFIENEYLKETRQTIGLYDLPDGESFYNHKLKVMTTSNLTAKEVHEIGLKEIERITIQMKELVKETGFKGTYQEFLDDLKVNPKFYFDNPNDLMMTYRDIAKRTDKELPRFFKVLPRLPYGVEPVPEHQAPSYPTAYYMPSDMNMTRAGIFYANTSALHTRPKYEMEALTIHEAVPGHHLQIALSLELNDLPKFRRMATADYTGYVEGWGLYSEKLGAEMGFYKDPYSKFGQLSFEIWRACRLVLDTGIHAFKWTRQQAIDFLKEHTGKSEEACVVEIDRYVSIPGQAAAYKIGEIKILELRNKFELKKGSDFDIREFHDVILRNGALPLNVLENYVDNYLSKN